MRICLIAEGSYPYVTGGVSNWIQTLVTGMPEHEFVLHTIGAHESQRGQFRYELPVNMVAVYETFLAPQSFSGKRWARGIRLTEREKAALAGLLGCGGARPEQAEERIAPPIDEVDWEALFGLFRSRRLRHPADLLAGRDFLDLLVVSGAERYGHIPLTELFWSVRSMLLPLIQTLRQHVPKADLYHAVTTGYAGVFGALASHLYGKPLVVTEHGIYSREREEEILKADWVREHLKELWIEHFYRLSACAYRYADRVLTLFDRNREIEIELGCPPEKTAIVPNGIEVEAYGNLPAAQPDGRFRIGAIVRVVPIKDIKTMILSFALIKRELPEAELYIMGPVDEGGEYEAECRRLVESLGLADVYFTGHVNVREWLGRMDLMLLTSVSEGQPLAVLEGMAAGLPWVVTDVGDCRGLVEGSGDGLGPAGIVVPVMHVERIAAAAVRLARDPRLRAEMGRNGRERVRRLYTRERFINEYRRLYDELGEAETWRASASN